MYKDKEDMNRYMREYRASGRNASERSAKGKLGALMRKAKSRAKKKGIEYSLSPGWAVMQFNAQAGRCYHTDKELSFQPGPTSISIDRLDSSKGYTEDNCALCCTHFNAMKGQYDLGFIEEMCNAFLEVRQETDRVETT